MIAEYKQKASERQIEKLPPLPLTAEQTALLVELVKKPIAGEEKFILNLLENRIPPGVDEAAYVKASFLTDLVRGKTSSPIITAERAVYLLGTMLGGYNVNSLIEFLASDLENIAQEAVKALSKTLLIYTAYNDLFTLSNNNKFAKQVVDSWAKADWFLMKPAVAEKISLVVFKVDGETNTDDLSPATHAWSRPDIPLHAKVMLKSKMPDVDEIIASLKEKNYPIAFVGDVVGTGSSRKSAMNSVMWHFGTDIPYVPNKRTGSYILGSKIAPIFFNTAEDSGAYPIECDVSGMSMGDIIHIYPYENVIKNDNGEILCEFATSPNTIQDEVRAGGRVPLIIGRGLTDKTREALNLPVSDVFTRPTVDTNAANGFTLAQKMVGVACGLDGVKAGVYCEPRMSTVGSQDTTGSMTRDELKELACLGFSADFVLQSFCHTAAYPKPIDIKLQHELPDFVTARGGVALRPGDGIIHSWLNRMLLPDKVGTGGDSHTRFPLGISFPAGSGLVAFAATLGVMPINMPESVLVRFTGKMQAGITLRDLVNAIPYKAEQLGLLTIDKKGKKNIFNGRILEIEGLPDLKVEQAFELSDASAERSANGCTIALNPASIKEYMQSNIALIDWMIDNNYADPKTLHIRREAMQSWLDNPSLLKADHNAEYTEVIEIDLNEITEPLIAVPNDPDHIKPLSEIADSKIEEVFIGSCMTNIGHYRVAANLLAKMDSIATKLWIAPPTKMDERQLIEEGHYSVFGSIGARTEIPGCSLCMGNQARVADGAHVFSTSTRNFPNRLGKDAQVYLGSAELATICATLGKIPTVAEYMAYMQDIEAVANDLYQYLQFDQMPDYVIDKANILEKIAVIPTTRL